jgi:hypothetical protein
MSDLTPTLTSNYKGRSGLSLKKIPTVLMSAGDSRKNAQVLRGESESTVRSLSKQAESGSFEPRNFGFTLYMVG